MIWCTVQQHLLTPTLASALKGGIYDIEYGGITEKRVSMPSFEGGTDDSMSGNILWGEVARRESGEVRRWEGRRRGKHLERLNMVERVRSLFLCAYVCKCAAMCVCVCARQFWISFRSCLAIHYTLVMGWPCFLFHMESIINGH